MPDALSIEDVERDVHERDGDGELVPVEETIDYRGEEKTVKHKPITTGLLNKLSNLDDAVAELEPGPVLEALQEIYVEPDFSEWTEDDVAAFDGERLAELLAPLDEKVEQDIEGN